MAFTYSKLASTTVGAGGTSAITFSNIPQNYTDLVLKISGRISIAQIYGAFWLNINGTTTNRTYRYLEGNGASASSGSGTNTNISTGEGNSNTANTFASVELYFPNYTSSNYKSWSTDSVGENNATTSYMDMYASLWSNVAAISQLSILPESGTILQYSTATLYGIRVEL